MKIAVLVLLSVLVAVQISQAITEVVCQRFGKAWLALLWGGIFLAQALHVNGDL